MAKQIVDDDDFDENGILKDGRKLRVGMMMRDSLSPLQRAIAVSHAQLHDGLGNAAGHKPGYVFDANPRAALQDAYDEYDVQQANAWRSPSKPVEANPNARPMTRDEAYAEYDRQQENAWRLPANVRGDR